jgi:hypothetical protein
VTDIVRITFDRNDHIHFKRIAEVCEICAKPNRSDKTVIASLEGMQIYGTWTGANNAVWIGYDHIHASRLSIELSESSAPAPGPAELPARLRGIGVHRVGTTILIPLPRELWRPTDPDPCQCAHCRGATGYWDTLAVSANEPAKHAPDLTWMPHAPQYQRSR